MTANKTRMLTDVNGIDYFIPMVLHNAKSATPADAYGDNIVTFDVVSRAFVGPLRTIRVYANRDVLREIAGVTA